LIRNIPGLFGVAQTDGFVYNVNGLTTAINYGNGLNNYKTYDNRAQLTKNVYGISETHSNRKETSYSYSSAGNIQSVVDGFSSRTLAYNYDGVNRLITADIPATAGVSEQTFTYDNAGNRVTDIQGQYLYTKYDLDTSPSYNNYTWGSYQQLESKTNRLNSILTKYEYTSDRLLGSIKEGGITKATYTYDALGRRLKTVEGNTTTITLYAGNDIVYEVKKEGTNPEIKTRYLVLAGKYLAKMVGDEPNLRTYYYHTDHLGSIRAVSNSNGNIVGLYTYDPFGNVVQEISYPDADRLRFTGKRLDSTGLYYFNARYYDPALGRFISADPARQGLNWYVYCDNNPLMYVDPDGCVVIEGAALLKLVAFGSVICVYAYQTVDQYKEEIADAIYNMYEKTKQQIQTFPRCFSIDSSSNRGGSSNGLSGSSSSGNLDPERRNKGTSKTVFTNTQNSAQTVAKQFNGKITELKNGYKVEIPNPAGGNKPVVVRMINEGSGGRSQPYFRVSIDGKGSYTLDGLMSSDRALTHIDMTNSYLDQITNILNSIGR